MSQRGKNDYEYYKMENITQYKWMANFYREIVGQRGHFEAQFEVLESIFQRNSISKNDKILDAACGTGDVAKKLFYQEYKNIHALDGSKEMLDQFDEYNKFPIPVEHYRWENLDTYFNLNGEFDVIYILGHSLPHASTKTLPDIISNIFRGLRENGIFIFDMRNWQRDINNRLIQPNREERVYRFLGEFCIKSDCYWVEDKVSYINSLQIVNYRCRKINENCLGWESEITFDLKYSVFHHSEVLTWLSDAGFKDLNVEIQQYTNWPYLVFVCRK